MRILGWFKNNLGSQKGNQIQGLHQASIQITLSESTEHNSSCSGVSVQPETNKK